MSKNTLILIDEEALNTAANRFRELTAEVKALQKDIEDMLNDSKTGFDTPAGK